MGSQFQAAAIGVQSGVGLFEESEAFTEEEVRIGLSLVSRRCGGLEQFDGLVDPVLRECLQAGGVLPESFESIDVGLAGLGFDERSHQTADFRVESVLQGLLEDLEDSGWFVSGVVHGESEFDQRVGGCPVAFCHLLEQLDGRFGLSALQFDRRQQPCDSGPIRDLEDRFQFVDDGLEVARGVEPAGLENPFLESELEGPFTELVGNGVGRNRLGQTLDRLAILPSHVAVAQRFGCPGTQLIQAMDVRVLGDQSIENRHGSGRSIGMNQQVGQQVLAGQVTGSDLSQFGFGQFGRVVSEVISSGDVVAGVGEIGVEPSGLDQLSGRAGCLSESIEHQPGPEPVVGGVGFELDGLLEALVGLWEEAVDGEGLSEGEPVAAAGVFGQDPESLEVSSGFGIDHAVCRQSRRGGSADSFVDAPGDQNGFDCEQGNQQCDAESVHFRSPPLLSWLRWLSQALTPPRRRKGGITCHPPATMSGRPSRFRSPVATVTR